KRAEHAPDNRNDNRAEGRSRPRDEQPKDDDSALAQSALGAQSTQPTSLVPDALRDQPSTRRQRPPRRSRKQAGAEVVVNEAAAENNTAPMPLSEDVNTDPVAAFAATRPPEETPTAEISKPVRKTRSRKKPAEAIAEPVAETAVPETLAETAVTAEPARPARRSRSKKAAEVTAPVTTAEPEKALAQTVATVEQAQPVADPNEISAPPEKPKRGWWRR
ncbi:MAG: hypothetical protein WBQ60_10195, partial [Asticcacaulis sp.]